MRLDPAQQAAVESDAQNLLIVAGAGSGKTRVLVERMMHLVRQGTPAHRILATTFTRKAALEMESRLPVPGLRVGTFHSVLWEILKNYTSEPRRQIMDDSQRRKITSQIASGHGLDWKSSARVTKDFLSTISLHKNYNRLPDEFEEWWNDDDRVPTVLDPTTLSVWRRLEAEKDSQDLIDFDDILLRAVRSLRHNPGLLAQISGYYDYFLVDEYQDTNEIQEEFVGMMIEAGVKTTVVGDYRQSIYRFRGANVEHIMSFPQRYPNVETVFLRNNYRSRQPIVDLGNEIISHNTRVIEGTSTVATRGPGYQIEHITTFDHDDQAQAIADRIAGGIAKGMRPKDVAILMPSVKTGSSANKVEAALLSRKIPYTVHRGTDIFDTTVFQQCMSVVQAKANPKNIHALRVAYECLPGIGETTASKIVQVYQDSAGSPDPLDVSAAAPKKQQEMVEELARLIDNPNKGLRETYTDWRAMALDSPSKQMLKLIDDERDPFETLGFLVLMYPEDISIPDFIDEISLSIDQKAKEDDTDAVFISTIHRSKGLEFAHVFVTGLEEGVLPRSDVFPGTDQEDESRRVFYVACTRAEETLTLYTVRMNQGKEAEPSRFLAEIPEGMVVGRYQGQERSPGGYRGYSRSQGRSYGRSASGR